MSTNNASYRKHNDHTHNSSTYHKKDGTPIRSILKREADAEIKEEQLSASPCLNGVMEWVMRLGRPAR